MAECGTIPQVFSEFILPSSPICDGVTIRYCFVNIVQEIVLFMSSYVMLTVFIFGMF